MTEHHALTDPEYDRLRPLLPSNQGKRGRPYTLDHRRTLDGILWVLQTGAAWRDLPARYSDWQSVFDRFNRWRRRAFGMPSSRPCSADGYRRRHRPEPVLRRRHDDPPTAVRAALKKKAASDEPDDHALGRSPRRIHDEGEPALRRHGAAGRGRADRRAAVRGTVAGGPVAGGRGGIVRWPARLVGDRGYSAGWVRALVRLCGMKAVIPYRTNRRGAATTGKPTEAAMWWSDWWAGSRNNGGSLPATKNWPSITAPWSILLSSCIT